MTQKIITGPAIWRYGRTMEPKDPISIDLKVEGWFTVELIDSATGLIKQYLRFKNLITDAGFDATWGGSSISIASITDYCAVGTDSTAPAAGQTALGAEISPASSNRTTDAGGFVDVATQVGASNYWKFVKTYVLAETQGNGNLTELGIFSAVTGGTMWSRQLFKDGGGTPTTVVKTAAEQLRITYEMRIYYPSAVATGTVTISAVSYDYSVQVNDVDNVNSWGNFLSGFNGTGSFGSGGNGSTTAMEANTHVATTNDANVSGVARSSSSLSTYVNGNFYREETAIWEPAVANFATGVGGIVAFFAGGLNHPRMFHLIFNTTKVPKTNVKRFTFVMRGTFTRYP